MKKYYEMDNDLKDKKINVYVSNYGYGKTYHEFQKAINKINKLEQKININKNKHQMLIDTINELLDEGKITIYVYNELMDIFIK